MKETKNKILSIFVILLTWPVFSAWITLFGRFWITMPLGAMVSCLICQKYIKTRRFAIALFYFIIILLYYSLGSRYFENWYDVIIEGCMLIFIGAASTSILSTGDEKGQKLIAISTIILLVFTSIASYIINLQYPDIIRMLNHETGAAAELQHRMMKFGMANYALPHAIPIIIPAFVVLFKRKKSFMLRVFALACIGLCVLLTFASGATTPFLLALFVAIMSFIVTKGTIRKNIIKIIILFVLMLLFMDEEIQISMFSVLDDIVGNDGGIHERILELQDSIIYGETGGDLEARGNRYNQSLIAFLNNPIGGTVDKKHLGGHSILLDRLGAYGLLGFIPYILILWSQFKYSLKHIIIGYTPYYLISLMACISMMATKNFDGWEQWCLLMIVSPVMINVFANKDTAKDQETP